MDFANGETIGKPSWLRRLFRLRTLGRALVVLAVLTTLVAIFYTEENWRGKRAWEKARREYVDKGEVLDLTAMAPVPVPDEQNFALAPLLRPLFDFVRDPRSGQISWKNFAASRRPLLDVYQRADVYATPPTNAPGVPGPAWMEQKRVGLETWRLFYEGTNAPAGTSPESKAAGSASAVVQALSRYEQALSELRAAAARPKSRFPIPYEDGVAAVLPHVPILRSAAASLVLRSLAELQLGQTSAAFEDVQLQFRLGDALRTEPLSVSQNLRARLLQTTLQTVWEGCADHKWSDAQLAAFEQALKDRDWLSDCNLAVRGERALCVWAYNFVKQTRQPEYMVSPADLPERWRRSSRLQREWLGAQVHAMPAGWFDRDKAAVIELFPLLLVPAEDIAAHRVDPVALARNQARVLSRAKSIGPHYLATALLRPMVTHVPRNMVRAQASADLARTACALERYRLAEGSYPESLATLAPRFIEKVPTDVILGGPLQYRRTEDGRFVLYSLGWDGKDDGGRVGRGEDWTVDEAKGDWVWEYPR